MRTPLLVVLVVGLVVGLVGCALSRRPGLGSPAEGKRLMDRLAALEGTWVAVEGGKEFSATFEVVSGGRAILQRSGYTLIYYPDGGTVMATLFPDDGHQVRMRAMPARRARLRLRLRRRRPTCRRAAPTRWMKMERTSPDQIVQRWQWWEAGAVQTFDVGFTRRRPSP